MGGDDGALGLTGMGRRYGDEAGRQASAGTAAIEVSHLTKMFVGSVLLEYCARQAWGASRGSREGHSSLVA